MTSPHADSPPGGELADADDQLGWDRAKHGTFAEHATPDDTVRTVSGDDYLEQTGDHTGG